MRRSLAGLLLAGLLLPSFAAPTWVLAADPHADGSVQLRDGHWLPPMPAGLQVGSVHDEMLRTVGRGGFDFGPPDPEATDGRAPLWGRGAPSGPPGDSQSEPAPFGRTANPFSAPAPSEALPNGLRKEIFGFLPYWMLTDSALTGMNYSLLSTVAYFSVGTNRYGDLVRTTSGGATSTGWAGWTSSRMTQVLDRAHDHGVRVVLTVTMMAWDSTSSQHMATLLGSSSARAHLVDEIVDAIRDRGADGVNLDFEPVPSSLRAQYTAFVRQLKAGLESAGVGDHLTVCVMAGSATWATGYDVAGLTAADAADALFVMGYDYHWSGSSRAGGVAPIESPYTLDVSGTMNDFLEQTAGSNLIWGVPYYGRTWPTSSDQLNATTLGGGSKAYTYVGHLSQAAQYGRRWDDVGKVPWYRWWDTAAGHWAQGYYDDAESLGVKYDLVNARGLAGTGMWTLLMDNGRDELWRLLADRFVTDGAPPVGGVALLDPVADASALRVSWRILDYASGLDTVDVQVREVGDDTWQAWLTGTRATSGWFMGEAGHRYAFRARGVDWKGNRQPWTSLPARPAELQVGTFAQVAVSGLNLRAAAGTGATILGTLPAGSSVHLLEGPVSANGYAWWRVQHSYTEWPSADYARTGWVAAGSASDDYLVPVDAPNRVRLAPFISDLAQPASFSPNGDGRQDGVTLAFRLGAAVTALRIDVLDDAGSLRRSVDLGAHSAGPTLGSWDGRLASGAWAPAGRYLLRVVASAADGTHVAPAAGFDSGLLAVAGITADLTPPAMIAASPAANATLVPVSNRILIDFSEPMVGVRPGLSLRRADGSLVPAEVTLNPDGRRARIIPGAPLVANREYTVRLSLGRDLAGNPLAAREWTFRTAPGTVFDPYRSARLAAGGHTAYGVGTDGRLVDSRGMTIRSAGDVQVSQRSTLPNLPGRWLAVASGDLRRLWLREAPGQALAGEAERATLPDSTRILVLPGTHVGVRFDSAGRVTGTLSATLYSTSGANVSARAIINGAAYLRVLNGIWAGYWLPESPAIYLPGSIGRLNFPASPRLAFAPATITGYRFDSTGAVTGSVTATLTRASSANASAWAVINGRAWFLVVNGIWAGTWVPEGTSVAMAVIP